MNLPRLRVVIGRVSLPGERLPGSREPAHPIAIQGCLSSYWLQAVISAGASAWLRPEPG